MLDKIVNRIVGLAVFSISIVVYLVTISRTVVFWDVGEFCAAAYLLQVPHPPGSPLFLLLARLVSMIPFNPDIAYRMHAISAVTSALGTMFLYLVAVKVIVRFRGIPATLLDKIVVFGASAIGALSLAFGPTYWDNAIEAEVYGISMFFVAFSAWLAMRWSERADEPHNEKYLFLIAYLIGLSIGVHLLAVLTIFVVMLIFYFTKYEFSRRSFLRFVVMTVVVFFVVYPGVVKWLPSMMDGEVGGVRNEFFTYIPFLLIATAGYGAYKTIKIRNKLLHIGLVSFLLIILGYSTYIVVIIRANVPNMPMNENNPGNLARLVSYLNREQYGEAPVLKRRYSSEPMHAPTWQNYSSDMDFLFRYQINHMYVRYLLWNYIGAAGDEQDAGVSTKDTFGIPFFIGLLGLYYHFRKDWKMAVPFGVMFLVMGVVLALYQNQQEPQPRERDYFYVGSFFVFSLWIAVGMVALIDFIKNKLQQQGFFSYAALGTLTVFVFAIPVNFARMNWFSHDRQGHYVAWDYSYNILQTCERDAIIFTNGDNDTFPLWYLQDVEGVRRDVRIVNLSLVNTPWYILQLKNQEPHGAKKVPISLSDGQIDRLQPMAWEPRKIEIPVPRNVLSEFGVADSSVLSTGKITFTMPNTLQFGDTKAIKVQDIMVYDIVKTTNWTRPVYFAVTVSPDSKIGLDDYLWMDGSAMRLLPKKIQSGEVGLHPEIMRANLLRENVVPSKDPQYGYVFRGLDKPGIYYDDNVRRMTMNYRYSFIRLALYYQSVENKPDLAKEVLARMERVLPRTVLPMHWTLLADMMGIYSRLGEKSLNDQYASELEKVCLELVERGSVDMQSYYNPYGILLQVYEGRHDYAKALDVLNRMGPRYANEPTVMNLRQKYQALLSNGAQGDTTSK